MVAERRMFTKKVTDDDNFMALSSSAQALYLHLSMSADDDGFCNQVSISMFKAHASVQDLQTLLEKRYIYQFENGVIVIKHWRMANALRKDRYTPTAFQREFAQLGIKDNGSYTRLPDGCQVVAERLPQGRVCKERIGKDREGESKEPEQTPTPTYISHGKYKNVFLTEEEFQLLKTEYSDYEKKIERLSEYMRSSGKTYENHYATICMWAKEDAKKCKGRKEPVPAWMSNQRNYDYDALEDVLCENVKTAGNDEEVRARADALREKLGGA